MEGDEKQDDIEPKACVCACGHFDFGIFNICFVGLILVGMTGFWQELGPRSW